MPFPARRRGTLVMLPLVALASGACATRSVLLSFPAVTAASLDAEPAPAARVGRAFVEDPPLPGEPTEGWGGLEARASSGSEGELTADEAVRLALANNRALRAAREELGIHEGLRRQAALLPNPTVELEVARPHDAPGPLHRGALVEWDLTDAALVPLRARVADAELEAAKLRHAGRVIAFEFEVRAAFHAQQAARRRHAIAQQSLDALAAARDAARALFDAGNVPELELATREAAFESARAVVADAELAELETRERLQRLLGLSGAETTWRAAASIPPVPETIEVPADVERRALEKSVEIAESKMRLEALARRTRLARTRGAVPDLALELRTEGERDEWEVGAGLHVTLPLFDRRQGERRAVEAEFDATLERHHALAVDVRSAAREARDRLASAHLRARRHAEVIAPAKERVLEQTLLQYNAMQIGIFELLQAQRDALDGRIAAAEALREFWTAKAALDALLAGQRVDAPARVAASFSAAGSAGGGH